MVSPHPDDIHWPAVTRGEVREAIYQPSTNKAPGPSQITFKAIRWAWEAEAELLITIFRGYANLGLQPAVWKQATAVALKKPKKTNYSNSRAY